METDHFTTYLVQVQEGQFKDDPIHHLVQDYLTLWEYEEGDVAGKVLGTLLDYAVRYHPELTAFGTSEMRKFLTELHLLENPNIKVGEIAGRANTGLAWVRARVESPK